MYREISWNLWCGFVCYCVLVHKAASFIDVAYEGRLYVPEGGSVSISCLRSSYGVPKWTKDGHPLREEDGYSFGVQQLDDRILLMSLNISEALWKHRGRYKCDALNGNYHRIEVVPSEEADERMREEKNVKLRPNSVLELRCDHMENGIFPLNWYKDGHRLLESEDDPRIVIEERSLKIRHATEEDSGDYLCVVEVSGLSYPATENLGRLLKVTYGARVEKFPPQIRPILNHQLNVECKVHGFPVPRITWFVDDIPMDSFQMNDTRFEVTDNADGLPDAVFSILNASYADDGHVIRCSARNMDGVMDTSAELAVRETVLNTNEEYPGKGIILTPGLDLVLQCNVTDDPSSNLKWLKNGLTLNMTDGRIHVEKHNNTLVIDKATERDTGNYTCITPSEKNVTIVVRTRVILKPFDNSRNVVQGQNIVLVCNASQGMPLPVLEWFKNQERVNGSHDRITIEPMTDSRGISGSKLTITDAEFDDRAEYMCVATNDISTVNTTILVRVKDKYAALWPFLGICAEVAVLCTVIFIYEKKRQKPDFDESEAEHNTENKTVPEQEDKTREVRQRK